MSDAQGGASPGPGEVGAAFSGSDTGCGAVGAALSGSTAKKESAASAAKSAAEQEREDAAREDAARGDPAKEAPRSDRAPEEARRSRCSLFVGEADRVSLDNDLDAGRIVLIVQLLDDLIGVCRYH